MVPFHGRCALAIAVAATLAPCLPAGVGGAGRRDAIHRRFVLAVGVRNFPMIPTFVGTEPDANAIAEEFETRFNSDQSNGATIVRLIGKEATRAKLLASLDRAAHECRSDDLFVFYF